jgi:hypothetical protein
LGQPSQLIGVSLAHGYRKRKRPPKALQPSGRRRGRHSKTSPDGTPSSPKRDRGRQRLDLRYADFPEPYAIEQLFREAQRIGR